MKKKKAHLQETGPWRVKYAYVLISSLVARGRGSDIQGDASEHIWYKSKDQPWASSSLVEG